MAVLVGTRSSFELIDCAGAADLPPSGGIRPGPRVLRRFEVGETRRPVGRPAAAPVVPRRTEPVSCEIRPHAVSRWELLALGLLAALTVLCLGLVYVNAGNEPDATVPERTVLVRVQPGESVWSLAERWAPGSDTAAVASRIVEMNDLRDSRVAPGQPLVVPDGLTDASR
ncbi:LysM peptidoglycan-binding domain-containing protein [Umezawaea beigongshangensis]|uniref:LysM peptidoglycan-binding domain-containing protein n=1 Tax=Umezawaea beigongshangensis TaxID=2780383 RepID=UPI0018F19D30|nr:LysM peptidoglycan-binding domain-containing protein [Umezawaea beigongshangensis]